MTSTTIGFDNGLYPSDGRPYVAMHWGAAMLPMRPGEARQMALIALSVAAGAEVMSAVYAELTDPNGLNLNTSAADSFMRCLRARMERGAAHHG